MENLKIRRRLSGSNRDGNQFDLDQAELLDQVGPIVVLGDAGMGKTTLLEDIGQEEECKYVSARQLVRSNDPQNLLGEATCFVIDALDELAVQSEGDAVDAVLRSLEKAGYPKFILSCRVADWRSATSVQALEDSYKRGPQELFLEPIRRKQARALLAGDIGDDRAEAVLTHFERRGLDGLFGNPQTLMLIRSVANYENLPISKAALFDISVKKLWAEHSPYKLGSSLYLQNESDTLDAAGCVFSLLLLTGKRSVSRLPIFEVDEDDLPISEVNLVAVKDNLQAMLPSRLFTSNIDGDPDRFSYTHRSVGEFLAARWLASKADTDRKRRRLLNLFHQYGLVPTNLRGVHAWLTQDTRLANEVIAADPMGIVEYGDTEDFTDEQARILLESLFELRDRDPRYGSEWPYPLRGIPRPSLCPEIKKMILCLSTPVPLRDMLLRSVTGTKVARMLAPTLEKMVLNPEVSYHERHSAGSALVDLPTADLDWARIFTTFHNLADQDSLRLAIELLPSTGLDNLSDLLIAKLIVAYYGLSICVYPRQEKNRIYGILWRIEKLLPCERIEPVLKILSDYLDALTGAGRDPVEDHDIINLVNVLCERILEQGRIEPSWLWPLLSSHGRRNSPYQTGQQSLSDWFQKNVEPRQKFQRFILLEQSSPETVKVRGLNLISTYRGLYPNECDIIELLGHLKPGVEADGNRWKDLVKLCRHDKIHGKLVRNAAAPFATEQDDKEFLERLANPQFTEGPTNQYSLQEIRKDEEQKKGWAEHRTSYLKHIDGLRTGDYSQIIQPANAYLGDFIDIDADVPAHKKIEKWLGPFLQDAAFQGFEAYLTNEKSTPTASEIATLSAEGQRWFAAYIFVAATAERVRNKRPLDDLPDDRLLAVLLEIRFSQVLDHAQMKHVAEVVEKEVKRRPGQWEAYWRLRIEPQLDTQIENVDCLYEFSRCTEFPAMVSVAKEWLGRFPDMAHHAEVILIDCLMAAREFKFLKRYVDERRKCDTDDDARSSNWDAVAFIVDYDAVQEDLFRTRGQSPDFLWCLRSRFGRSNDEDTLTVPISAAQLAWTIKTFRRIYQPKLKTHSKVGASSYDPHASKYIGALIDRLGGLTSVEATEELAALRDAPDDGYTDYLKRTFAEQAQKVVEKKYVPLTAIQVAAVLNDRPPKSIGQLQEVMVEKLTESQRKIRSHSVDWYKDFFKDGNPKDEEACRDTLLKIFGDYPKDVQCEAEGHLADNTRTDIRCTIDQLMLPIEVKGQWHRELWHAADTQLSRLYSTDWRAERKGIYLVFWFGSNVPENKKLQILDEADKQPASAEELRLALIENSTEARQGNIEVFVMDMVRAL